MWELVGLTALLGLFACCFECCLCCGLGTGSCSAGKSNVVTPPEQQAAKVKVDTNAVLGLRCIAALVVAYGHWPIMNGTSWYEYHGGAAVTLFFVVSGFIMTVPRVRNNTILPANFTGLVLGCIEAKICK